MKVLPMSSILTGACLAAVLASGGAAAHEKPKMGGEMAMMSAAKTVDG